jgi:hypothetical protein
LYLYLVLCYNFFRVICYLKLIVGLSLNYLGKFEIFQEEEIYKVKGHQDV